MPRNPDLSGIHVGGQAARPADGKCHRKETADFGISDFKSEISKGKGEKVE